MLIVASCFRFLTLEFQLLILAMDKGRFLNQKLGKRMSRRCSLLKSRLAAQRTGGKLPWSRLPKKGPSRKR